MKNSFLPFVAFAALLLFSCNRGLDPESANNRDVKKYLHSEMQYYYYWNEELPSKVDYNGSSTVEEFFNSLLVPRDRWSWMETGAEYAAEEQGSVYGTYGASLSQPLEYYNDYDVKVRYVIPGSPFDKAGVTRGWTVEYINGESKDELVNSGRFNEVFFSPPTTKAQTFVLRDTEGKAHEMAITAASVLNMRPGLRAEIYDSQDYPGLTGKVGYFHYLGFQAGRDINGKAMIDDIKDNMRMFRAAGIKNLILDLRYNGGGDSRASDTLVCYLAPKSAEGKVYTSRKHNKELRQYDVDYTVSRIWDDNGNDLSLDLDCLYVLTGRGTASASEMVLNGLKPLMHVEQVGDTTYGKPNGMYVFLYPADRDDMARYDSGDYEGLEYAFLPICFYNSNGNGEHIPDDGIKPGDGYRPDDLYHDFGPEEDNIAACLYHIVNGNYPPLPTVTKAAEPTKSAASRKDAKSSEEARNKDYGIFKANISDNPYFSLEN